MCKTIMNHTSFSATVLIFSNKKCDQIKKEKKKKRNKNFRQTIFQLWSLAELTTLTVTST